MDNSTIFGPIPSRRFGLSLGINLSLDVKQCNFDCLYCELTKAKTVAKATIYPSVDEVISELLMALEHHKDIDVITLTANGEPTLYPYLDELVDKINKIKGSYKLLILSNGSTIMNQDTFKTLLKIDIVKLSLDCVSQKCFKKLDRVHKSCDLSNIVEDMAKFSKEFRGDLVLETLFVEGVNDKEGEVSLLNKAYSRIKPLRVDLSTIHRPPAYDVKGITFKRLQDIASKIQNQNILIASSATNIERSSFSEDEIVTMLKLRPLSRVDIDMLFSEESKDIFNRLLKDGKFLAKSVANLEFFYIR
jgi:wyosine [tRNA(Phe)-imidazoG37] synthetase (radical SAM superfamily)